MSYTLVEVVNFDTNIVVPEGTDDMHDAAEVIQALGQKLANRTRALKAVTDVAARLGVTNNGTITTGAGKDITSGGKLIATDDVNAGNDLNVGDDANIGGNLTTGGKVSSGGAIELPSVQRIKYVGALGENVRSRIVPYGEATIQAGSASATISDGYLIAGGGGALIAVPIRVPNLATVTQVQVMHLQSGTATQMRLMRTIAPTWDTGAPITDLDAAPLTSIVTDARLGTDVIVTAVSASNFVVHNDTTTLWLALNIANDNAFIAARIVFLDPGPRND